MSYTPSLLYKTSSIDISRGIVKFIANLIKILQKRMKRQRKHWLLERVRLLTRELCNFKKIRE